MLNNKIKIIAFFTVLSFCCFSSIITIPHIPKNKYMTLKKSRQTRNVSKKINVSKKTHNKKAKKQALINNKTIVSKPFNSQPIIFPSIPAMQSKAQIQQQSGAGKLLIYGVNAAGACFAAKELYGLIQNPSLAGALPYLGMAASFISGKIKNPIAKKSIESLNFFGSIYNTYKNPSALSLLILAGHASSLAK